MSNRPVGPVPESAPQSRPKEAPSAEDLPYIQLASQYNTEQGRGQLGASIVCVRGYAIDLVERQGQPVREALSQRAHEAAGG